ncbi:MAG: ABC transporter permease subunit [Schumannella sp.]
MLVSMFGGYLVRIYAWRSIFGTEGIANSALIGRDHRRAARSAAQREFAIIIAMINFYLPLGILPIYAAMQNVGPGQIEAAQDLGSSRLRAAGKIVLPLALRGCTVAFVFTFIATAAEWLTPQIAGRHRGPDDRQPDRLPVRRRIRLAARGGARGDPGRGAGRPARGALHRRAEVGAMRRLARWRRVPWPSILYVGAVLLFLFAPLAIVVLFSFHSSPRMAFPFQGFSLRWYEEIFTDVEVVRAMGRSAIAAVTTGLVTAILGTLAGLGIVGLSSRTRAR